MTHPEVRPTPDATHRAKNLNKTSQRHAERRFVFLERGSAGMTLMVVDIFRIYEGESLEVRCFSCLLFGMFDTREKGGKTLSSSGA